MKLALDTGYAVLAAGGRSVDAVIAAITVMENFPLFNAGKGAVFTYSGKNELDASIMDGSNLMAGAVAGVTTIRIPIKAAYAKFGNIAARTSTGGGIIALDREGNISMTFNKEGMYRGYIKAGQEAKTFLYRNE